MLMFDKWALPDGEEHLQGWMLKKNQVVDGRLTYQYHKYESALTHCKNRRHAVDVGAHVALFSYWMARDFEFVHSFEPVAAHRDCYLKNMDGIENAALYGCALGQRSGFISIETEPTSSGDSRIDVRGTGEQDGVVINPEPGGPRVIPIKTLDSFDLSDVDFIKLDCEGSELFALRGGEQTIKRYMPVIIVEQKPGRAQRFGLPETGAVDYLKTLGYRQAEVLSGDFILVPA